jgi:hypothetical protein
MAVDRSTKLLSVCIINVAIIAYVIQPCTTHLTLLAALRQHTEQAYVGHLHRNEIHRFNSLFIYLTQRSYTSKKRTEVFKVCVCLGIWVAQNRTVTQMITTNHGRRN